MSRGILSRLLVMLQLLGSAIFIAALVFTLVSIITAENWQIKHLPKVTWVFIVIFIPLIGMALWWIVGREYGPAREEFVSFGDPRRREALERRTMTNDEDVEAQVQREIEYHEREARIRRLEAEVQARRAERG